MTGVNAVAELDFSHPNLIPPSNVEAEECVLGGIMLDPGAIDRVIDILKPEHFYISGHREIYRACLHLHGDGKQCDLLMLSSWLRDNGALERVGGRLQLANILESTVAATNIDALANLVKDAFIAREIIRTGNQLVKMGYDQSTPVGARMTEAEKQVFAIRNSNNVGREPMELADICLNVFNDIENIAVNGVVPGIRTGFYDFDSILGGLHREDLIIIAGRPGMGKSTFANQIAFDISRTQGLPSVIFSLEMSKEQVTTRLLSCEAKIEGTYLREGKISDNQWGALSQAINTLSTIPLLVDDTPCPKPQEIAAKCRKIKAQRGDLGCIVIDYLQLMADAGSDRLVQRLGEITRQCKLMARELSVPVILLSQLNRGVEERTNKRPLMSDLRDSGRIEEDADIICMLYRDEYYHNDTTERSVAEVIVAKHRNGPTGTIKMLFDSQFTCFKNFAR